nr:RluA family pseudouridine synthase [Rhodothalassium salexigens]
MDPGRRLCAGLGGPVRGRRVRRPGAGARYGTRPVSGAETVTVGAEDDGVRLDRWFKRHYPGLGFGAVSKLVRTGQVRVDGKRAKVGDRLVAGQAVRVPPMDREAARQPTAGPAAKPRPAVSARDAADLRARVLHKDDHVLAIAKPAGLAVQGGSGVSRHLDGMLDALMFEKDERPRLIHRLDKDTSGVLLLGRTAQAAAQLGKAFRSRAAHKVYWALVMRVPRVRAGEIRGAMDKQGGAGQEKMALDPEGKTAVTLYSVVDQAAQKASWLALKPLTGRTHQLRVHSAAINHPIVGDGKYGGREAFLGGQVSRNLHLHARAITLPHPAGGRLSVTAPLEGHMLKTWETFGWDPDYAEDPFEDDAR